MHDAIHPLSFCLLKHVTRTHLIDRIKIALSMRPQASFSRQMKHSFDSTHGGSYGILFGNVSQNIFDVQLRFRRFLQIQHTDPIPPFHQGVDNVLPDESRASGYQSHFTHLLLLYE